MAKAKKSDVTETLSSEVPAEAVKGDKKARLAKLLAKAKQLEGTVVEDKKVNLKKKVKDDEEEEEVANTLVPMEYYLKSSIHLGTRVITPDMRQYVYRRRADGLAVFNTALLDEKMRAGIAYLNKFAPQDVILVCKREAGWKAVKKFAELTGIRVFTKKYPAGILTNTNLETFFETKLVCICDSWLDKNALEDAYRVHVPVFSVCDTNNFTKNIDFVLPGNNKSAKSLGMILFLLAKYYCEHHAIQVEVNIQDFIDNWDSLTPPK
jgi:small subunit ribosomal protein S2